MELSLYHKAEAPSPMFPDRRALVHPLSKILHVFYHPIDSKELRVCIIGGGIACLLACFISHFFRHARVVMVGADHQFLDFVRKRLGIKTFFVPAADHTSVEDAISRGGDLAEGLYRALGAPPGCFDVIFECSSVGMFVQMAYRLVLDNPQGGAHSVLLHSACKDDPELRFILENTDPCRCAECHTMATTLLNDGLLEQIESTILGAAKRDVDFHMWLSGICNNTTGLSLVPPPASDQPQDPLVQLWAQCTNIPPPDDLQVVQAPQSPPVVYRPHEDDLATCYQGPLFSPNRLSRPLPIPTTPVPSHPSFDMQDLDFDGNLPGGDPLLPVKHLHLVQEQVDPGPGIPPPVSVPLTRSSTPTTPTSFLNQGDVVIPQVSTIADPPVVPTNPSFGRFRFAKRSCSCPKEAQKKARHERVCPDNPNRADNDIVCVLPGCGAKFSGGRKDNLNRHMVKQHGIDPKTYKLAQTDS
ncbi:hypothetical protein FRB99_001023 [Tulasnella sp. 403]|nr:hypothetical protein FRB99_001023 [Tulasnella sp. 403]